MRLVTFSDGAGTRAGALVDGGARVVDLHAADPDLPSSVIDLLRGGPETMARARATSDASSGPDLLERGAVHLHAPIPVPGKFLCIGYNYRGHGAGSDADIPEYPDVFAKTQNTVVGTDDAIRLPRASQSIDYEGELGVVLGATASAVSEAEALDYVAGYTVVNDVSARDVQKRGSQWVLGKSFDTFGPMGPALVTADEIPDPQALEITVRSNETVTVRSTTADMIFPVAYLVSYLSSVITLEPGDVIATGTPGKIPEIGALGRFMQAGDIVAVTYGAVGTLANRVEGPR
jgi:2-keto-4-pentenoate hydratase/2-oxohepta-3-ene-1,7-dioic acid hydratase in catechol pathway